MVVTQEQGDHSTRAPEQVPAKLGNRVADPEEEAAWMQQPAETEGRKGLGASEHAGHQLLALSTPPPSEEGKGTSRPGCWHQVPPGSSGTGTRRSFSHSLRRGVLQADDTCGHKAHAA